MDAQDLDTLVPEPKQVKFGGTEYELPADLPMEIFLRMNRAATLEKEDGTEDTLAQIEALTNTLSDLFIWQMEEKGIDAETRATVKDTVHKVLMRRGTRYCFQLVQNIYREDDEAAEAAAEADPTQPPAPPAAA